MSSGTSASEPTRQLILAPHTMREAILLHASIATIRRNNPHAQLDAVATRTIAPVLDAMQAFDDIIAVPDHLFARLRGSWKLAASLRARDYELSYNLNPDSTAALAPWMARIPRRIGLTESPQHATMNRTDAKPAGPGGVNKVSGQGGIGIAMPLPELVANPQASEAIHGLLNPGPNPNGSSIGNPAEQTPLIVMSPGAIDSSRRWPTRHFASLATQIKAGCPTARLVLIGTVEERQICTEVAAMGGLPFRNLAGQLDTAQQIALLRETDVLICNESDLMHLAAACAAPTVAVYGPSDPGSNPPMSSEASALWLALECSPCDSSVCPLGHNNCLNMLEPGRVIGAVEHALAANSRRRPVG